MKLRDPLPELAQVFKGTYGVAPPKRTKGRPSVQVVKVRDTYLLTFSLRRLVHNQTFLGFYPTAANLPKADNLKIGDYALLHSGEVVQIEK